MPIPADDESISDDERLYFRVFPLGDALVPLDDGCFRPNSGAFKFDQAMSVDLGSMCAPEETQEREQSRRFHVACITAGALRAMGCVIQREPVPGNPSHALIWGAHQSGSGALTGSQRSKAAKASLIVLVAP